jgi:transposase-like protein
MGSVVDVRESGIELRMASPESIYTWRRQDRIDKGLQPGLTSAEKAELTAAKRRIAELEAELAIHRRASERNCGTVTECDGDPRQLTSEAPGLHTV